MLVVLVYYVIFEEKVMAPKEKANELVNRYYAEGLKGSIRAETYNEAKRLMPKRCALIAVEEILKSGFSSRMIEYEYSSNSFKVLKPVDYWQEVKQEIKEL